MRPVGGFQWTVVNLRKTVAQPSYTVTGLKDETAYEFRVSAENKVGQSQPSDVSEPAKYGMLNTGKPRRSDPPSPTAKTV